MKELIASGDHETVHETHETTSAGNGTWDHTHPCAIIVRLLETTSQPLTPEIAETLNAYGYLLPDGTVDTETAEQEIDRRRDACQGVSA